MIYHACMTYIYVHVYGPMEMLTECSESAVLASVISGVHIMFTIRHMGEYLGSV